MFLHVLSTCVLYGVFPCGWKLKGKTRWFVSLGIFRCRHTHPNRAWCCCVLTPRAHCFARSVCFLRPSFPPPFSPSTRLLVLSRPSPSYPPSPPPPPHGHPSPAVNRVRAYLCSYEGDDVSDGTVGGAAGGDKGESALKKRKKTRDDGLFVSWLKEPPRQPGGGERGTGKAAAAAAAQEQQQRKVLVVHLFLP